jgi:hypothetical protein
VWYSPSSLRAFFAGKLTPERKAWFSKTRHGEQAWQRSIRRRVSPPASSTATLNAYDARDEQDQALAQVRAVLDDANIEFAELPRLSRFAPTLVVDDENTEAVVAALLKGLAGGKDGRSSEAGTPWTIRALNVRGTKLNLRTVRNQPGKVGSITCLRRRRAANGRELTTPAQTITVELWTKSGADTPRADGGCHLPGTLLRRQTDHTLAVDYIEPTVWHDALSHDSRLRLPAPHLRVLHEPVDIVYTWVDGSDPEWRRRMSATRDGLDLTTTEPSSVSDSRFTSRDELKYSLRSLEYYASWARRVFIVTDGQVPSWLNTDNPKITVIDHHEIFSDPSVLPVFNSHAIESQLHHIPGLSDHYLYLNDDCFFLRPTDPELFFTANGLTKHFPSIVPIDIGGWTPRDLPIISAAKQGRDHVLDKYGNTITHRFKHTPHPQLRPVLEAMESEEPELFAKVAASPFRSPEDVSIPSSLHHLDAFARGQSIEGQIGYQFVDLSKPDLELRLLRVARRPDLDVFCLNETTLPENSDETVSRLVSEFFESRFPVPSSFECHTTGSGSEQ